MFSAQKSTVQGDFLHTFVKQGNKHILVLYFFNKVMETSKIIVLFLSFFFFAKKIPATFLLWPLSY